MRNWSAACPGCRRSPRPVKPAEQALLARGFTQVIDHRTGCAVYLERAYDRRHHRELGLAHVQEIRSSGARITPTNPAEETACPEPRRVADPTSASTHQIHRGGGGHPGHRHRDSGPLFLETEGR